jgi:uncharacterized protein
VESRGFDVSLDVAADVNWRFIEDHDVTIGPSADGGYYLLCLQGSCPRLFDGIAWSTSTVYEDTLRRARENNLNVLRLQE